MEIMVQREEDPPCRTPGETPGWGRMFGGSTDCFGYHGETERSISVWRTLTLKHM